MPPLVAELPYWAVVTVVLVPGFGLLVMFWVMRSQIRRQKADGRRS